MKSTWMSKQMELRRKGNNELVAMKEWIILRKYFWLAIIVVILLAIFPFFLNWVLQRESFVPVIGDSATWLAFWGTYIGTILTALMVFATFITLHKTVNLSKSQWKMEWLRSYRASAAELLNAIDITAVGQFAQDVNFGRFEQVVKKGNEMERAVKRSSFLLSSYLKEYDYLFKEHKGNEYIDELNRLIGPFLQDAGELIQFAIICDFLKKKKNAGKLSEGILAVSAMTEDMAAKEYFIIAESITWLMDGEEMDVVVHNAVVKMQKQFAKVDIDDLAKFLLRISSLNARNTYDAIWLKVNASRFKVDGSSTSKR